MPDDLFVHTTEFLSVVASLRGMHPRYRELALYAANWWGNEEFIERLLAADLPAEAPKPTLTLVQ